MKESSIMKNNSVHKFVMVLGGYVVATKKNPMDVM